MRVLIAPNAFKHSLSAAAAAEAIQIGLKSSGLRCTSECFPIADGGDGTGELIIQKHGGKIVKTMIHDPLGRVIRSSFGLIENGHTAVIEMASASGVRLLKQEELAPVYTSTFGTGEMLKQALDSGAKKILLGVGGSATVDGGAGILQALGVRFFDDDDNLLSSKPESLVKLSRIDVSGLDQRILDCELIVLCDVHNKLLGNQGAAAVFGPQKGASNQDVETLERALLTFNNVTLEETDIDMDSIKHGGAAGGAAAGLATYLNATLVDGADYFLQLTGFDRALAESDLVITGEGNIDEQTLQGKGPFAVAIRAKKKSIFVIGLAGQVPQETNNHLQEYFDVLMAIGHQPLDIATALKLTSVNLIRISNAIGNLLSLK